MTDKQKNGNFGDHVCSHKGSWALNNWLRRLVQNPRKIVGEYIKEGDSVIDFGCGPGFFTVDMAQMVGDNGKVTAVDLQEEMLTHTKHHANNKKVGNRIAYHRCQQDRIGLEPNGRADFKLAYYMIHETPDPAKFLQEVKGLLKKGGKFLVVEPPFHVNRKLYQEMLEMADQAGFQLIDTPKKKGGHSALFTV